MTWYSTSIFCSLPQSTKVLPTASSVTVFQLAENQTLNRPATVSLIAAVGWAAGAAPAGLGGGEPSGPGFAGAPAPGGRAAAAAPRAGPGPRAGGRLVGAGAGRLCGA